MNGMERVLAALQGTPADRVPVFCNLIDQGAHEMGMSLKKYYSDGANVACAQLRMREKYRYDNLWSLFYVGKEAELLGCRHMVFAEDGPPNVGEMIIRSRTDIDALRVPEDVASHAAFAEVGACLEILRRETAGAYPLCAYISSTMTLPTLLMGMEKWLPLLLGGPAEDRDALLAKCHEFFVKEVTAYREAGADIIVYSNPFGSTDVVPWKFLLEHSLPWIEKDIRAIGTEGVVYYCGSARLNPVIETIVQQTGIGCYYLSPLDEIAEGKRLLDGRGLCCGVINDIRLITWTPDQVRGEVKRIMAAGKAGGRFLFGTLMMPLAIPEPNIRAMMDAAAEYGRYQSDGAHG